MRRPKAIVPNSGVKNRIANRTLLYAAPGIRDCVDGEVELLQKSDDIGGGNREPGSWEAGKLDDLPGGEEGDRQDDH